ncbi:hypothetical protein [Oceanicola granulosus]|uniref:hypothetical protein n=1 Tax=Oceanicola granulosus TaxID=252302 RepID=UPI00058C24F1|nr:hypothetical protein [Oceanicola granulosus]
MSNLTSDPFVEPREAFDLVGRTAYEDDWNATWIDDPDADEHREVRLILRNALKSGQVRAHWSTTDFSFDGDLLPRDVDEFFQILLREDRVFHARANQPVYCKIHRDDLSGWMRSHEERSFTTQRAKTQCLAWLVEQLRDQSYCPTYEELRAKAKTKFSSLSQRAFKEAREEAIKKTGREDLSRPGRRKKTNQ